MAKNMDDLAIPSMFTGKSPENPGETFLETFDYIPSQRERNWGLYVPGVGRKVTPPVSALKASVSNVAAPQAAPAGLALHGPSEGGWGVENKGRVLRDYALVYFTGGHGFFRPLHGKWRRIQAGTVLMLFPGIRHAYHPSPETGWTERWVLLNGELANQWCMRDLLCVDTAVLDIGVRSELLEAFDRLIEIAHACPPFANQIQAGVAMEILALVHRFRQVRKHQARRPAAIETALKYMAKNWAKEIDFEALASRMGIGYRHFRRQFQQATGVAPHQHLLNLRLNHAKRLLSTLSVAEVAARVGFSDPLYFSRIFKRKVGVAPTRWH